ncbi:hypothetical protein ABPG72_015329 [Tetrahymena utriculariae]
MGWIFWSLIIVMNKQRKRQRANNSKLFKNTLNSCQKNQKHEMKCTQKMRIQCMYTQLTLHFEKIASAINHYFQIVKLDAFQLVSQNNNNNSNYFLMNDDQVLSQESRISNESQYIDLTQIAQTRRIFAQGANIREFSAILQNRVKTRVKLQMLSSSSSSSNATTNKGVISFKSVVLTSTIQKILHESGLELILLASKSTSKKLSDHFLQSSSSLCESQSSQSPDQVGSLRMMIYDEKMICDIAQKVIEINQQQQEQAKGHQCNSKECCFTLLDMAKNSNTKQLLGHMCKVIVKNGWCVHQLFNYVDYEVQDVKLNEQIFQIISEKMNDIKNACELGGNLNICRNCQEQRQQQHQQYFLCCQKNSVQQNDIIQQQIQPNEVMQQSQQYTNSIQQQQFSFVHQESSLEQPQVQQGIALEKQQQQQAQQFQNNPRRQENHQQHLKQVQDDSIKKHISMQEVARSRSQSPITKSINKKQ